MKELNLEQQRTVWKGKYPHTPYYKSNNQLIDNESVLLFEGWPTNPYEESELLHRYIGERYNQIMLRSYATSEIIYVTKANGEDYWYYQTENDNKKHKCKFANFNNNYNNLLLKTNLNKIRTIENKLF